MSIPSWTWDVLLVAGGGLVAVGLYLVYPPSALLGSGGALIYLAIRGARKC